MRLFKKKHKRNTLILTVDGLISRIKYSLANGWAYIQGGGLKVGFYGIDIIKLINYIIIYTHTQCCS